TRPIEVGPGRTFDIRQRRVRLAVSEAFSGVTLGETTITTGEGGGDCGFDFSTGREYLVYASAGSDGSLSTSICSPTMKIEDAKSDLEYLRNVPAPPGRDGRLIGIAIHTEPLKPVNPRAPVAGMRVVAEGEGLTRA